MSNIENIKAEIKRLKKILEESTYYLDNSQQALGYSFALDDFKEFIDSLPEEKPSEDLDEEVKRYYSDNFTYISSDQPTLSILTNVARHFAEWQKEQIVKEVKFGVVCKNGERDEEDVWIELNPGSLPDYKDTDPIDFIIVKQDDRPRD